MNFRHLLINFNHPKRIKQVSPLSIEQDFLFSHELQNIPDFLPPIFSLKGTVVSSKEKEIILQFDSISL